MKHTLKVTSIGGFSSRGDNADMPETARLQNNPLAPNLLMRGISDVWCQISVHPKYAGLARHCTNSNSMTSLSLSSTFFLFCISQGTLYVGRYVGTVANVL